MYIGRVSPKMVAPFLEEEWNGHMIEFVTPKKINKSLVLIDYII
jgi:hypothetical protein